jgi:hypothetical protein
MFAWITHFPGYFVQPYIPLIALLIITVTNVKLIHSPLKTLSPPWNAETATHPGDDKLPVAGRGNPVSVDYMLWGCSGPEEFQFQMRYSLQHYWRC